VVVVDVAQINKWMASLKGREGMAWQSAEVRNTFDKVLRVNMEARKASVQ